MPLYLNTLFAQANIPPANIRLLRHQDRRSARGRSPYELWRDDRPAFELYQGTQSFGNRSKLQAGYWASFVVAPTGDTLLAGLYRCRYLGPSTEDRIWPHAQGFDPAGSCDTYELALVEHLSDLAGRLVIDWGASERAWIQRADNQNKVVLEIRAAFQEPEFPGFERFIAPLSTLEGLPQSWRTALSNSRGIYLLTCPKTKEQYVGAAYGEGGFFGRWLAYVHGGHGGNVALRSRDPSDYQVSILEVAGSSTTIEGIAAMETLWKRKLQSREMGLNRN